MRAIDPWRPPPIPAMGRRPSANSTPIPLPAAVFYSSFFIVSASSAMASRCLKPGAIIPRQIPIPSMVPIMASHMKCCFVVSTLINRPNHAGQSSQTAQFQPLCSHQRATPTAIIKLWAMCRHGQALKGLSSAWKEVNKKLYMDDISSRFNCHLKSI